MRAGAPVSAGVLLGGAVALGVATLCVHEFAPSPWSWPADSYAPWCLAAWLAGATRSRLGAGALRGVWVLAVVVASYYAALLVITQRGDFLGTVVFWAAATVPAGLFLGALGALSRKSIAARGLTAALPGTIFIAEVVPGYSRIPIDSASAQVMAAVWAVCGVVVLVALTRTPRALAWAAVGVVPCVALMWSIDTAVLWIFPYLGALIP